MTVAPKAWFVGITTYKDVAARDKKDGPADDDLQDEWEIKEEEDAARLCYEEALSRDDLYTASWGPVIGSTEWYNVAERRKS